MSFKDQLRNWLGGLWQDFWLVSPRRLLTVIGCLLFALFYFAYRMAYFPSWLQSPFSSLLALLGFGLLCFNLYKQIRRFLRSVR